MRKFFQFLLFIFLISDVTADILKGSPPFFATSSSSSKLYVNEFEHLTLECNAQNSDQNVWFRNNEDTGIRTKIFFKESVTRNDSAVYKCLASNAIGSVFSMETPVIVQYVEDFDTSSTSYSVSSFVGGFIHLKRPNVISSEELDIEYSWIKNEEKINLDSSHYITSRGDLIVTDVKKNDFGTYQALGVTSNFGDIISKDYLVVDEEHSDQNVPFRILAPPTDRTILLGEDLLNETFDCVTSFSSDYVIRWFIDGSPITSNTVGVKLSHNNRKLTFINSSGFSSLGKGTHNLQCKVSARSGILFEDSTAVLMIIDQPVIEAIPSEIQKPVGSSVSIRCNTDNLISKIRWFFNGNKIPSKGKSLTISPISGENYGIYQCEARNEAGTALSTTWLKEGEDSTEGTIVFDQPGDSEPTGSEPVIVEGPSSATVPVGLDEFSFKCVAEGDPSPSLVWKFEDNVISKENEKYKIKDNLIVIHNIQTSDTGQYSCIARNVHGTRSKNAFLSVSKLNQKLLLHPPTNQSMLIGTSLDIPCEVHGDYREDASTTWFFNDEVIENTGNPTLRLSLNKRKGLHISQVGPDSIGEYRCVVTLGSKSESASMWLEIIEKPSMPNGVSAVLVNDTLPAKIRVDWEEGFDGNSPIIRYIIQMHTLGQTELWSDWETVGETDPAENCCSFVLDNLKPSVTAEFRVIAANKHGGGKPSLSSEKVTMPQQPPAAAPKNVAAQPRSSNSIVVQWQKPQEEQFSGDILGYIIRYRLFDYKTLPWTEKNVTTPDARNAIIDQLITWQSYEIQVAAYNERGLGVFSKNIQVSTLEGTPTQAPKKLNVQVISSTSVEISFLSPDQQRIPGVNLGYKVQLWKGAPDDKAPYKQIILDPISRSMKAVIEELEKFGHYNLTVLCFTREGDGPKTNPVPVITKEDTPDRVSSLTLHDVMYDGATVTWNPPIEANGIITRYILRYWNDMTPEAKTSMELSGDQHSAVITGLQPTTKYSVDIFASTSVGDGPRDESKFESGRPPVLPGQPSSLFVSDIQAKSVHLSFIPGHDGFTAIRQWIVEAKVMDFGVYSTIFNISAPKAKSFVVKGLRPYTQYQLRLIAVNVKGKSPSSEPTKMFETKQMEPESLSSPLFAEPVSATTISLSWTPLLASQWNGQPKGYLIMYRAKDEENWKEIRAASVRASDFALSSLLPYTVYEIELFAENMVGRSSSTGIIQAKTYESVPSQSPENIRAVNDVLRTVIVRWNQVRDENKNGEILGYTVRLVPESDWLRSEETRVFDVPGANNTMTKIAGLKAFTKYNVHVSAYTIVGNGKENSQPPMLLTEEDLPGPPSGVSFSFVSEDQVRLKWMPPENPNGKINGYVVSHWITSKGSASSHRVTIATLDMFAATELEKNTQYSFSLAAINSVGTGPEAHVDVFTSSVRLPVRVPPRPVRDDMAKQTSTQVSISWDSSSSAKGDEFEESPIRSVQIEYQKANEDAWNLFTRSVPGDKTTITVNRLSPNTAYRFRIKFTGDFQSSSWSPESDWFRTLPAAPTAVPLKIIVVPYDSSSISLQWATPEKNQWNADAIGYHISYKEYPSNESWRSDDLPAQTNRQDTEQYILPKLESFRHYIVRMSVYNSEGDGPFSAPSFIYVGYSIPKKNVTGLMGEAKTPSSITLHWDEWSDDGSDYIIGFKVRFVSLDSVLSTNQEEELVVVENNSCTLNDLKKFSEYQISVSPYNRAGEGGRTAVRVRTREDIPGPVNNLHFTDVLLNSAKIVWDTPALPNGLITKYTVNYRSARDKTGNNNEVQSATNNLSFFASNLKEGSEYIFTVWAETAAGRGTETIANITVGPNISGPAAPSSPTVVPGQSSVTISWKEMSHRNIIGYLLQAKRVSNAVLHPGTSHRRNKRSIQPHTMGEWVTLKVIDSVINKYEISYRELEPSSQYVFRVFARDERGIGYPSKQSDELEVPASIPDDPFYTSWWFIGLIAMSTFVVIVVVIAFLCVTGSQAKFKREKRNSVDSLQLADGNFINYQMNGHRGINRSRNDLITRPGTTQSWLSDKDPPAYGSVLGVDRESTANGGSVVNMYGLATDVMPQPPNQQAMQRLSALVGRDNRVGGSAYVTNSMRRESLGNPEYTSRADHMSRRSDYGYSSRIGYGATPSHHQSEYEDSFEDDDPSADEAENNDIASHYGEIEQYRDTWRRVRDSDVVRNNPDVKVLQL
ncbi:unnamed protein product [Auanema sp. JU1783]|nr:unnamed protein product [Auanema sp. JU1783]